MHFLVAALATVEPLCWRRKHSKKQKETMSVEINNREKVDRILERDPNVTIFLQPIAAPAALGLAGFAG
jgi:hypothetical protein